MRLLSVFNLLIFYNVLCHPKTTVTWVTQSTFNLQGSNRCKVMVIIHNCLCDNDCRIKIPH